MKKILVLAVVLLSTVGTYAQFEQGTKYVNANVTGLGLSYSSGAKVQFGLGVEAGYYVRDSWMIKGNFDFDHKHKVNNISVGAGARYHFYKNGIFVGAGLAYEHSYRGNDPLTVTITEFTKVPTFDENGNIMKDNAGNVIYITESLDRTETHTPKAEKFNSVCIPIEVGYTFYLNHHLAIEPSVYYKMSLNHFGDCSTIGLRLGLGYFF